jgi:hypothetical protein
MPSRRAPRPDEVRSALAAVAAWVDARPDGPTPDATVPDPPRADRAAAVRTSLAALEHVAPGRSVEVRVPPFGAVQCVPGPRHTRGTPPNVVEADAETWLGLATGDQLWADALAQGRLRVSGTRAHLDALLPLTGPEPTTTAGGSDEP